MTTDKGKIKYSEKSLSHCCYAFVYPEREQVLSVEVCEACISLSSVWHNSFMWTLHLNWFVASFLNLWNLECILSCYKALC